MTISEALDPHIGLEMAPDVSLHIVEDTGLVLCEESQRVYSLSATSTFIWIYLENGDSPEFIGRKLASTFGIPVGEAKTYVSQCIDEWDREGLTARGVERRDPTAEVPTAEVPLTFPMIMGMQPTPDCETYRILDSTFTLRFPTLDIRNLFAQSMSHFSIPSGHETPFGIVINRSKDGSYELLGSAGPNETVSVPREGLVPALRMRLLRKAFDESEIFISFHAAALAFNSLAFLLVGPSGSGKSTLTTALLSLGCKYFSDDIAILRPEDMTLRPCPVPLATKEGSWQTLAQYRPELLSLPIHAREDGKRVRYLVPNRSSIAPENSRYKVGLIIFVSYLPEAQTQLEPVRPVEAIGRLFGESLWSKRLTSEYVSRIVDWVNETECLTLTYSDLESAAAKVHELGEAKRKQIS